MSDAHFMGMALGAAHRGAGRTAPNPMVGAVVVRDGVVIGEGFTQPPGQDHAEVHALRALGGDARGATVYVTLEPCCHHGRTPPCTDALIRAGVSRVVVGTIDPYPLVAGRGIAALRAAGIEVDLGVREEECLRYNLGFFRAMALGLPAVTLKAAITLDGRIADVHGESRWISGPPARDVAHRLRSESDAILVGVGTVLADDPTLTTRVPGGRDAAVVVLDTRLRTPPSARLFVPGRRNMVFIAEDHPASDLQSFPGEIHPVGRDARGRVSIEAVLRQLASQGFHRVLAEGGGEVHRSLLSGSFVDRAELFLSGRILAGGPAFVGGPGFALAEAPSFRFARADTCGDDLHLSLERPLEELLPDVHRPR